MSVRVLVTGDREWTERDIIYRALLDACRLHYGIAALAHGDCRGADRIAAEVAATYVFVPRAAIKAYPALWDTHGRSAGPIRNRAMYDDFHPDLVLAFHDDLAKSRGTADMIRVACAGGTPVWHYGSDGLIGKIE